MLINGISAHHGQEVWIRLHSGSAASISGVWGMHIVGIESMEIVDIGFGPEDLRGCISSKYWHNNTRPRLCCGYWPVWHILRLEVTPAHLPFILIPLVPFSKLYMRRMIDIFSTLCLSHPCLLHHAIRLFIFVVHVKVQSGSKKVGNRYIWSFYETRYPTKSVQQIAPPSARLGAKAGKALSLEPESGPSTSGSGSSETFVTFPNWRYPFHV